jgi:hypothetical protein
MQKDFSFSENDEHRTNDDVVEQIFGIVRQHRSLSPELAEGWREKEGEVVGEDEQEAL